MANTKKKRVLVQLLNSCYRSTFTVHPANWKDTGADPSIKWYFSYRFYDPSYKEDLKTKGSKQVICKGGVNMYSTLMAKRQLMEEMLENERVMIDEKGYNPISGQYMKQASEEIVDYEVHPDTPLIEALTIAVEKKSCSKEFKDGLKLVLNCVATAAKRLRYDNIPVSTIKRRHAKILLTECGKIKKDTWTANNYNHHLSYLSSMFFELVELETIEYNPAEKISRQKTIKRKRTTLTVQQRILVYNKLREENFRFWLLMNIFYLAGCRRTEIMRVKGKDVDFESQKFSALVKKGKSYNIVDYTITDVAVSFWKMAMIDCGPEDYVFSVRLKPGPASINPRQITRRWRTWVKNKFTVEDHGFTIDADFYSLKHLHTTEIAAKYGTGAAANFNNESVKMIQQHYDVGFDDRQHSAKKRIGTTFVPDK